MAGKEYIVCASRELVSAAMFTLRTVCFTYYSRSYYNLLAVPHLQIYYMYLKNLKNVIHVAKVYCK